MPPEAPADIVYGGYRRTVRTLPRTPDARKTAYS